MSTEKFEADILDFCDAIEAAAVNLKQRISKKHGVEAVGEYDPEKISWVRAEGKNGVYERYPAYQQKASMDADYVNLVEDLKLHNGHMQKAGLFYWLFNDNSTVGRKASKRDLH